MGLSNVKTYAIVAFIVAILGGGGIIGVLVLKDNNVTIDAVTDNSIECVKGTGTYAKGSSVCLSVQVHTGWILDGVYDSDGNFLWSDAEMCFTINGNVTFHFKTHRGYGVEAYGDGGILSIVGNGTYNKSSPATVTATLDSKYTFLGWYNIKGTKVSDSLSYSLSAKEDTILIAKTNYSGTAGTNYVSYSSDKDFNLSKTNVILIDKYSEKYIYSKESSKGFGLSLAPGVYQWMVIGYLNDGTWCKTVNTFTVEGNITNEYVWTYNSQRYSITWTVSSTVYEQYCGKNSGGRAPSDDNSRSAFVNYTSAEVKAIADQLKTIAADKSMSDNQRANFVLKFVQLCTEYETDMHRYGQVEHWKYPAETIFERSGDCEDTSILYCALMKYMGNNTCLLLFIGEQYAAVGGHAAAGVVVEDISSGYYYDVGGKHYYYCETTSDTYNVGKRWELYSTAQIIVIN